MAIFQPITWFFFIYYLLCTLYTKANNSWRDHYKNIVQCKTNMNIQSRVHISIIFCKAKASVFVIITDWIPSMPMKVPQKIQNIFFHLFYFYGNVTTYHSKRRNFYKLFWMSGVCVLQKRALYAVEA